MRKYNAFSLMEMMVVLLITAIVAAATAPMVNRKLMENQAENATPWVYSGGLSNDIVYNLKISDNMIPNETYEKLLNIRISLNNEISKLRILKNNYLKKFFG